MTHAPFLVWPVARREFYRAISFALVPTLLWGCFIFGWRALAMILAALLAASLSHSLLKRFTHFGKVLVYPHAVTAALLLAALAQPFWPAWIVTLAALLLPLVFAFLGGPGKEPLHLAVIAVLALQFIIPLFPNGGYLSPAPYAVRPQSAILARDRLLMGDIRNQASAPLYRWPSSFDLQGNDAVRMTPPAAVVVHTFDAVGQSLSPQLAPVPPLRQTLDAAFASQLPGVDAILLGAVSGRIGLVSLAGILIGGLYLAYRYILRPRSVALFLIAYALLLAFLAIPPDALAHADLHGLYRILSLYPGELLSLHGYLFLTTDAPFAAVFLLALPGTEPLTPRGRRIFLVAAALLAACLARFSPIPLPPATTALTLLMPAAPTFDRLFARHSWLTRA